MPHWRQVGATYFVTFRLADSLPQNKLDELESIRREWDHRESQREATGGQRRLMNVEDDGLGRPSYRRPSYGDPALERMARALATKAEACLDEGHGCCLLREKLHADELVKSLHHFDGQRYDLGAYVVMPNHVHVIVRPTHTDIHPLEQIVGGWKQFSAKRINMRMCQHGELWQDESYDRLIRDEEHLYLCVQYIGRNATNAKLPMNACPRWIRPEWQKLGWGFEDAQ